MKKLLALLVILCACNVSRAQNISVDLKDAPVRTTLEMMFKQAGIKNYVIDNSVAGFITMKLEDQPFENSLKIVMRAATVPLTYTKENDVWIVKQRIITPIPQTGAPHPIPENPKPNSFQVIKLNHIDPFDLMNAFGFILNIDQFQRYKGGFNGQSSNMGLGGNNGSLGNNNNNPGNQNGGRRP